VVLFDIDGTLLSTPITEEGEGRRYVETIRDVVGKEPYVVPSRFAGMVDPQICKILLSEMGLTNDRVEYFLPKVLWHMGEVYGTVEKKVALNTGVTGLLAILATSPGLVTGVLTGNLKAVAEQKLTCTGIRVYCSELFCADKYFDRTSLVKNAVRTCVRKYELSSTRHIVIVGDTPRDIEAANASETTSVGIATGVYSMAQLGQAGATHVFPNLEATEELLASLGVRFGDAKR
jgi:phosphoglycolate phosphatase-like HAD superfamily hydrolase